MNCYRTGLICLTPRRCNGSEKCQSPTHLKAVAAKNADAKLTAGRDADGLPAWPGSYWAKHRIVEDGTADEDDFHPSNKWEVVEVFTNDFGTGGLPITEGGRLMVFVAGIAKAQSLENFVWGPGPLDVPK